MRWLIAGLLLWGPAGMLAAPGPGDAARDLARKLAAVVHEPAALSFRNLSSLDDLSAAAARAALDSELQAQGVALSQPQPAYDIRITVSENPTSYLLVAEVRHGEERQVLLTAWPRGALPASRAPAPAVTLEKKLLREQAGPILDAAGAGGMLLVLEPGQVTRVAGEATQSLPIVSGHPWPRDVRGRLVVAGAAFRAFLPGTVCTGVVEPFSLACQDRNEPWPLESAGSLLALADFASNRNYFTGRVVTAPGGPHNLAPFFTAASAGDQYWLFAGADGRARWFTRAWEPAGSSDQLGSGVAGVAAACGHFLLASRPGEDNDAVQAWTLRGADASPAGSPVELEGPVTALWPAGAAAATAVTFDPHSGHYAAYSLALSCGS